MFPSIQRNRVHCTRCRQSDRCRDRSQPREENWRITTIRNGRPPPRLWRFAHLQLLTLVQAPTLDSVGMVLLCSISAPKKSYCNPLDSSSPTSRYLRNINQDKTNRRPLREAGTADATRACSRNRTPANPPKLATRTAPLMPTGHLLEPARYTWTGSSNRTPTGRSGREGQECWRRGGRQFVGSETKGGISSDGGKRTLCGARLGTLIAWFFLGSKSLFCFNEFPRKSTSPANR